jgi:hypothetical protein
MTESPIWSAAIPSAHTSVNPARITTAMRLAETRLTSTPVGWL